jgi:hypothetical protein
MEKQSRLIIGTIFILLILITSLFLISIIKAEENSTPPGTTTPQVPGGEVNPETGLPKNLETVQKVGDTVSDPDKSTSYLKQEWQKILQKSKTFGPIITFILKLDPVSVFLLGIPIAFSWLFFLTLILFIDMVIYVLRITKYLFLDMSNFIRYTILILVAGIFVFYKIPLYIANFIVKIISLLNAWWMQFVIIGIVILALILAGMFSKEMEALFKSIKENHDKTMEEISREKLRKDVKTFSDIKKAFTG